MSGPLAITKSNKFISMEGNIMEVILLEKIQNLGGLGDRVNVKPGYARNYLVPHGKALTTTPDNVAVFETRRSELEAQAASEIGAARTRAKGIEAIGLRMERKVNDGRLFGSVSASDVVDALIEAGVDLKRSEVRLPEGPIRQTGKYEVRVHVHPDVDAVVKLAVVSEDADDEEFDNDSDAPATDEGPESMEQVGASEEDAGASEEV